MLVSSHAVTSRSLLALALAAACGGGKTPTPQPPPAPAPDPGPGVAKPPPPPPVEDAPIVATPHDPEWFEPAWKKVGVGQTISFGVSVIDQDLDETRVIVTKMPKTARFDALTQTVTWTPAKDEVGKAEFEVAIEQTLRAGGTNQLTKTFAIDVD